MAVSKSLVRLLRVREMEEEQRRLALEKAMGEVHRLRDARKAAKGRERAGRELVAASARSGEIADRQAGLAETEAGRRKAAVLGPRVAAAELEAARLRQAFLEKRVERRQAETIIAETRARDHSESGRREQQAVDDWYGARLSGDAGKRDSRLV